MTGSASRGSDWLIVICALLGMAVTAALGIWQMERLSWKQNLLAQIAARSHSVPVSIDEALRTAARDDIDYLRVRARGHFLHDREMRLFAVENGKPGWHIITPLQLADARSVLVNRGFVPHDLELPSERPKSQPEGAVEIVGLARSAQEPSIFTPDHDRERNRWFWRDINGMAEAAFPSGRVIEAFLIEQEATPARSDLPRPGATRLDVSNRHFEYALTWFGLCAALFAVTLFFLRSRSGVAGM